MKTGSIVCCLAFWLAFAAGTARCEVPELFRQKEFTASSLALAANHYIEIGEEAAVKELRGLGADAFDDFTVHEGRWSVNERIGWMCRILFEPKSTNSLRPPAFGALTLPQKTMPPEVWPLYPIALSGTTYFVLSEGYSVGGHPEDPRDYLDYCQRAGSFRKSKVVVPTQAKAKEDASALHKSAAWQRIRWRDGGVGWYYDIPESWAWDYIQNQADRIAL